MRLRYTFLYMEIDNPASWSSLAAKLNMMQARSKARDWTEAVPLLKASSQCHLNDNFTSPAGTLRSRETIY